MIFQETLKDQNRKGETGTLKEISHLSVTTPMARLVTRKDCIYVAKMAKRATAPVIKNTDAIITAACTFSSLKAV